MNPDLDKYKNIYICTCSGKKIHFLDLNPDMISIEDIAHSLSHICRFNGHSRFFYSICEHSLMTADMVEPRLKIHALLHDAGEAYLSDISSPLKRILNHCSDDIYDKLEQDIIDCIYGKIGLKKLTEVDKHSIKLADATALYIESHHFFDASMLDGWHYGKLLDPIPQLKIANEQRGMNEVKYQFLYMFETYMKIKE